MEHWGKKSMFNKLRAGKKKRKLQILTNFGTLIFLNKLNIFLKRNIKRNHEINRTTDKQNRIQ